MYRQSMYIFAIICGYSISAATVQEGVEAYIEGRTNYYFSGAIAPAQQDKIKALRKEHPEVYDDLNTFTNQTEMPGSRHVTWLADHLNPMTQWFSSKFGWHNAILDALRPELQNSDANHRKNIDAYMQAVKKYVYNSHNVASYASRDILVDLLKQIQLTYVFDIPYKRNLFVQLIASLTQDDVQYVIAQLKNDLPKRQAAEKIELFKQLINHFNYLDLALQAVATESDDTAQEETKQKESAT